MSKKKFIKFSYEWEERVKDFFHHLIDDVLNENELTIDELCQFIDVDPNEIDGFLHKDGDLSLLTIGKLLIGSNLTVDVTHANYGLSGDGYEYIEEDKHKSEEPEEWDDEEAEFNEDLLNDAAEDEDEKDMREAIRETLDRNPERILKLLKAIFGL